MAAAQLEMLLRKKMVNRSHNPMLRDRSHQTPCFISFVPVDKCFCHIASTHCYRLRPNN